MLQYSLVTSSVPLPILIETVLPSYSCEFMCRFHIQDVTVTPFDKALLKCPTAVQVEVVKNL